MATGKESVLDLTMVSDTIAGSAEWEIMRQDTIGSDHYPHYDISKSKRKKK